MKWVGDITCIRTWEGPDLSGDRPRLLHQESGRLCDGGQHAHRPDMRGDRYGGPQVPDEEGEDDLPPQAAAPRSTSEQLARHLKGYGTRPSVGRTGVCWAGAWAEVDGCDPQGTKEPTPMVYPTRRKAINDIAFPGRAWYTSQTRLHSALGYRTPNEAEHDLVSSNKAA